MVFYLGCDVSKQKLDVSCTDERGVELWTHIVPNEPTAIAAFLLGVHASSGGVLHCVVEATGILHLPLAETCAALGVAEIDCRVYNPILTRSAILASVRGKKTDRTDAVLIARIGLQGAGNIYTPEIYRTVKYYARGHEKCSQLAADLTRYEHHLTDVLGTELAKSVTDSIAAMRTAVRATKQQLGKELHAVVPTELHRRLQTIPGIGPVVAASLIGEIQDMRRFGSVKALIAYVGFDPKVKQSGHSLNTTGRISKRGSPHVRRNLFLAANVARQHDPYFKAIYDKKRGEGKRYTVATIVVVRKLLAVVRCVWLEEREYYATPAEQKPKDA